MSARVHLQNLPPRLARDELERFCDDLVADYVLEFPLDERGHHHGFAVLTFRNFAAADDAVAKLESRAMQGNTLHAQLLGVTNFEFADGSSALHRRDDIDDSIE